MAAAQRPTSAQGLSRFLVEHSSCGAGFDVGHPRGVGGGAVSVTCLGCGKTYEHEVGDFAEGMAAAGPGIVEVEREIEFAPVRPGPEPLEPKPLEPKPQRSPEQPGKPAKGKGAAAKAKRDPARGARERLLVVVLLVFALLMIAFAAYRVIDARDSADETTPAPTESAATTTLTPAATGAPETTTPEAQRRQVGGASLVVPTAWTQAPYRGGTLIGPPGTSPVSIQVYETPTTSRDMATVSERAITFASSQVSEPRVGSARTKTIAGGPAYEVTVRGEGARRDLLVSLTGSTRYLLLGGIGANASAAQRIDVRRALLSFLPGQG